MGESTKKTSLPKVSTVVPIYRGANYIKELIERFEACRISCPDLFHELILVCDDPADDSSKIIAENKSNRDWVRVYELASNGGQHLSTSVVIMHTYGDWVATIDEDLQFPPELIPEGLKSALERGLDLIYIKSTTNTHSGGFSLRDLSSRLAKRVVSLVSTEDYTKISSFRIIRGGIARGTAFEVDRHSYLDTCLLNSTSTKRRGTFYGNFKDKRTSGESGYTLSRLLHHYSKLVSSVSLDVSTLFLGGGIVLVLVLTGGALIHLMLGIKTGALVATPGWASIYALNSAIAIGGFSFGLAIIKYLSILIYRSSGGQSFHIISRLDDEMHLESLNSFLANSQYLRRLDG